MADQVPDHDNRQPAKHDQALAALAQLAFHLNVQRTALNEADMLTTQLRGLWHCEPLPEDTDPSPTCMIDLGPIPSDEACALPCGHVFHSECIERWLECSNNCPCCRTAINPVDDGDENDDDDNTSDHDRTQGADPELDINDSRPATRNHSSASSVQIDMALIEQLAFHHRLIAELELLSSRAEALAAEGTEAELNSRWTEFLREQIAGLEVEAERLTDAILGPDEDVVLGAGGQ